MQEDSLNAMTTAERVEMIRQFGELNPHGTVIIPGGEVMMDLPELFALAGACKAAELELVINSNGSYVVDEEIARKVVESGITRLSVSLDSHIPEIHQYARGIATAFHDTVRAIRLLVAAAKKYNPSFFLSVSCVVFDRNLRHLPAYVDFCRELEVTRADFQLLSRTFANKHPTRDVFWEEHFFHSPEAKVEAFEVIAGVIRRNNDGFLLKCEADLEWIKDYLNQPDQSTFETPEPICGSHEKNLMVNPGGEVALCHFNWSVLPNDPYIGNAKEQNLFDLWTGPKAQIARGVMDQCRLGCGALNCHRR
jgi:MoaA/NifB/PqqE/SkfB family radical SAM enzyme